MTREEEDLNRIGARAHLLLRTKSLLLLPPPRPPPPMIQSSDTQLSDMSDTFDSEPKVPEISFVEAVDGVQPELSTSPNQTKINCKSTWI